MLDAWIKGFKGTWFWGLATYFLHAMDIGCKMFWLLRKYFGTYKTDA